jgi:FAD/FMN-containing dehydrogenase
MPASAMTRSLPQLAEIHGSVVWPGDPDYDQARTVMYGGFDQQPAVIVQAADEDDVARVIALARETGLPLAVRSGGHDVAGHSTTDGIVLDLRRMNSLEIDADERTAWAGPGLTAVELNVATGAHGLAVGFGDAGSVGLGGITLGGGVGYLVRKHGLTIDSLLAAEIVTAGGHRLRADPKSHPDLFWAIRGGGGNFGVATRFHFRLHEVPQIVGGMLILPATPEAITGFLAAAEAAPEELSAIANVMNCPPMPFVPEEVHGRLVNMAFMCFAGGATLGERALAPFRDLAPPIADLVKPMPYAEIYPPEDPDYHPLAVARTMFASDVSPDRAEAAVEALKASDASLRVVQLRVLGGAMASVPSDATAFAHRSSRIMINVASFYDGPQDRARRQEWVDDLAARLYDGDDGAYVNFLADEGQERVRAAYPGRTWERLTSVKRRYDPENLFRLNQNIPPASAR